MNEIPYRYFGAVERAIRTKLQAAPDVYVGEWQAIRGQDLPQETTIEVEDVSFDIILPVTVQGLQAEINPNLPWAEDHFQERVSGIAHNPPPSSSWWPYAQKNNAEHKHDAIFSHTYPERFWPKALDPEWQGLRFPTGDLADVVALLATRPGTRQAYLPVWFPEDTGATEGQRVPCTLGYHFMIRNGELKIVYYIRSCDFFRHFRDDVYMAARLGQWVAEQLGIRCSRLVMHISSMHVFSAERGIL